jgi:hypothetical protein
MPAPVLSENHIRTYWWCSPDRLATDTAPIRARPNGSGSREAKVQLEEIFAPARAAPRRLGKSRSDEALRTALDKFVQPPIIATNNRQDGRPCPYRKSNPGALMVQSAQDRQAENAANSLNTARNRRILPQR